MDISTTTDISQIHKLYGWSDQSVLMIFFWHVCSVKWKSSLR